MDARSANPKDDPTPSAPRLGVLHGFGADLRIAWRRLLATPMFTAFAVLSLAVGVGVTTAVYSVIDRIFWKEIGVHEPGGVLLLLSGETGTNDARWAISHRDFDDVRAAQTSFADLSAFQSVYPAVASETITQTQPAEAVDGRYFPLLGVKPFLGRLIQDSDDTSGSRVVVLGHALWRTRFAADPNLVGRIIRLSGQPFEVIGVGPETFEGPMAARQGAKLWVPRTAAAAFAFSPATTAPERERRRLAVAGRLKSGRTMQQASSELQALSASMDAAYPRRPGKQPGVKPGRRWSATTVAELNERATEGRQVGYLLFGMIALVLVVACTNLANLVLARGTLRQQEFAVRRALGAPRWRLVREQSAESAIVAIAGGVASWILIQILIRTFDFEVPLGKAWMTVSVQPEISTAALGISAIALLLSLVVFGLEPAMHLTKTEVRADLATGGGIVGVPKARRQRRLLRWQVAISAAFFIIATLCVRYMAADALRDSGVDLNRMAVAEADFYLQRWDESRVRRLADEIIQKVGQEPGIEAVSFSTGMPFGTTMTPAVLISTMDKPITTARDQADATLVIVTPHFFRATGIRIVRGRAFEPRDDAAAPPVVVLSESTALKTFGTVDVVGRPMLVKVDGLSRGYGTEQPVKTATIVGIAEDTDTTHYSVRRGEMAYMPLAQEYFPWMTIVARSSDASTAAGALRTGIRAVSPDLGIAYVASGYTALAGPVVFLRSAGIIAVSLGALTLLLAMVGLYGIQSHVVAYRTREIGVRMSLGASAANVRAMVMKDGYKPVLQGLAIGLFIGTAGRAIIRSVLTDKIEVIDPWMLLLVPIPLLLAAFFACFLPARRASRVDPNVALRHL